MNKRQRYMAGVEHAMTQGRRLVGGRSLHLSPTEGGGGAAKTTAKKALVLTTDGEPEGGGVATLDVPTWDDFEKPENEIRDPSNVQMVEPEDAIKALKDIQDVASRLARRGRLYGDGLVKLSAGLRTLDQRIQQTAKVQKAMARKLPDFTGSDGGVDLHNFAMRLKDQRRMNRFYFNLMALSPEEMGYAAMVDRSAALMTPHLRAWARKHALNEATKALLYEAQAINDFIVIADVLLSADKDSEYSQTPRGRRIRGLKLFRDWSRITGALRDVAGDTSTAGEGSEWVPTILSSQIHELIYAELVLGNYFEWATMPGKVWDMPVEGADAIAYLMGEGTQDPAESAAKPKASFPATRKMTLTAQKMGARVVMSAELEEDSAVQMVPYVLLRVARAIARGREKAILDGQKSSTIDTADVPAADDVRKAWNGLRQQQKGVGSSVEVDLSNFNATSFAQMKGVLKEYGQMPDDGVWITGYSGFIRLLTLNDQSSGGVPFVLTQEKFGPNTTFQRGTLGLMFGSPIVVSQFVREDLNASGVYDNVTTTKTYVIYTNRRAWQGGERRALTVRRSDDLKMETDQILVMGTWRGDFEPVNYAGTQRFTALGKNVASF